MKRTWPHGDTSDPLLMKWQSTLISLQKTQLLFNRRDYVIFMISREGSRGFYSYCYNKSLYFLAEKCYNCGAVGHIRAQYRRPSRRDRKEYKRDSDVVIFITTFTALSKILKLLNKECFKCEMSDSASFLNSHGKG